MNEYKGKAVIIGETTYILDHEIDQGGNSSIYKASILGDPRVFAIKILQTTKSKDKKERFLKEISFCERVAHPNVVPIYGHSEIDKHLCYVMPLYPKTLRHLINTERDYALGKIINELFTKENPSGSHYRKAFDIDPMLSSIDWVVDSCMFQNPAIRPTISEVHSEISFINEKITATLTELQSALLYNEATDLPEAVVDQIALKASKDILIAKNIFENSSLTDLDKVNCNYHKEIHFLADKMLKDIYFQEVAYRRCWQEFLYEAQVYQNGSNYTPLNFNDPTEKEIYHAFEVIVKRHHNGRIRNNLTNELLKIFASCCNYHCKRLLSQIEVVEAKLSDFDDAPIMYIVYQLRHVLERHRVKDIDLSENLSINWDATAYDDSTEPLLFREEINQSETDVMEAFQCNWDIVYRKIDDSHYLVRFNSKKCFESFEKYALALSASNDIFEADVQYILSNPQRYGNMVELRPLDSFDITNTIARILGLRTE